MRRIDIVIPAYNEESCLEPLHQALTEVIDRLDYAFRIIIVDDGSRDDTPRVCAELAARDPRVGFACLSRNFGHQAAITAGLDLTDADAVLMMDADLQHPPAAIPDLIEAWENGAEIVNGVRDKTTGWFKRASSRAFYWMLNRMSSIEVTPDSPDFRLIDRSVVEAVRKLREQTRFVRGMLAWVGFQQASVPYRQSTRHAGRSKYSAPRMFGLALSAMLSFARLPLRLATYIGLTVSVAAFGYGIYALAQRVVFERAIPGWTSLAVLLSILSGIQLLTLGVIGEYVGRIFEESKNRPLYIIAHRNLTTRDER